MATYFHLSPYSSQRHPPFLDSMENTDSSPMAPSFMVSAPGKVIVLGEHAAVYGKPVIAAAISLRSYLSVKTLSKSERTVTLNFKDIKMHHTWDIASLP